ncbi:cyclic nucleotide-binding domain-containing protein [Mycobacterium servetii]|uniref:Cyclic nucleotide-binding domain-containing protein n=1 Tax=Mycobacterium servetii TaxID=3237418 RepID=A0ABV4BWW6_9MYCO
MGAATALITALAWPQLRLADVLSAEDTAKLAVIRATSVLAPLPALALEQLARAAARLAVPAGAEVIRQGDPGDRFYMIAAGEADVTVDGGPMGTLGPGDSFGEIALLHDVPRLFTVTARQDLDLVVVDRAEFLGALSNHPGAAGRLCGVTAPPVEERLVELDRDDALGGRSVAQLLAAQQPLTGIGADELRELADTTRVVTAPDGAIVIREGDYAQTYYLVLDGAAQVLRGERTVRDLGPGDGFGEQATLRDVPRIATVRAIGDTTLVAVEREAFQRAQRVK